MADIYVAEGRLREEGASLAVAGLNVRSLPPFPVSKVSAEAFNEKVKLKKIKKKK
mgnify:CR=1 FL=1